MNMLEDEIAQYLHEDSFLNRREYTTALYQLIEEVACAFSEWIEKDLAKVENIKYWMRSKKELFAYFINNVYKK